MTCHLSVPVRDSSQPASARFAAHEHAERAGFDEEDVHRAGLVATELAKNLVKHATGGGELLFHVVSAGPAGEIEMVALDTGPGIGDLVRGDARRLLDGGVAGDGARSGPPAV